MPGKIDVNEIYLCAPIWGGRMASPAWFFLNRANLKGKKVNLLLTSGSNNDNYRTKAIGTLAQLDCVPGEVYGFAAVKEPEMELIEEQLRQMLPGDIF
jgi:hypothetical protein